jgi:hypothetical protein
MLMHVEPPKNFVPCLRSALIALHSKKEKQKNDNFTLHDLAATHIVAVTFTDM